ncbi:hypothetical protein Nepgr_011248 [Nepenthes gracilis]|uniref:C2 NT-type domain-containing protein n=1 Tax=Nepenthes gracilis TaxID=150966 RepID=A0AAD3SF02_NEPGR|nr:hypothetical protein Nepgr_011248 [Nepenthes gracilis]
MFKSARWRGEKNKITAVFKLRFHSTQVTQIGGKALILSVIPAANGKPTAIIEKSTIRDGCCYWENPVYETVKFVQDAKTGKFHDRIYNFIITIGSPTSSLVGEASVNIADYANTTSAATVSFPFKSSISEGVLHVSIQRVQENDCQRDLHETKVENTESGNKTLKRYFSNGDAEEGTKTNSTEDEPLRKTMSGLNGNSRASSGSDITLSSSGSSSGLNTPRELAVKNNDTMNASNYQVQHRVQWEWPLNTADDSTRDDTTNSSRDAFVIGRSPLALDNSVEKLKSDLVVFARNAEVSELELQSLRKQIVKESKRGQDLLREVSGLKDERDALKEECDKLKASQKWGDEMKVGSSPWALLEEIKLELNHEKDLNVNLRLQLQKTQESNSQLVIAVQDLEHMLEQIDRGDSDPSTKKRAEELKERIPWCQSDDDEEQKALEDLVKQHTNAKEAYLLEQKIMDLCSEIEIYRRDKDELEMQMEQLALDYEILKQENHAISYKLEQSQLQDQLKLQYECSSSYATIHELEIQIENLENELNKQSNDFSHSMATIKELESHIKNLEEELEKQAQGFVADLQAVTRAKVEQELEIEKLENELEKQSKEISDSEVTIRELESHIQNLEENLMIQTRGFEADLGAVTHAKLEQGLKIENLENELNNQSKEFSDSLATIKELEVHIQNLEEAIEKQAQGFEADLEALTRNKVEQEQRAIRAEESLRLTRWKNVNTAERLQEEFKRLYFYLQMQSTFEANDKAATKAMAEASALRLRNSHLEEMLQKDADELQLVRDVYEAKLDELCHQINMKSNQINQMLVESEEKTKQLEHQIKHKDEVCQRLSEELSMLRDEIKSLKACNLSLSEQAEQMGKLKAELKQMETVIKERELFVKGGIMDRDNLEGTIALAKEEAEKSVKELNAIKRLEDEKELTHFSDLRHSMYEDELEETLGKPVFSLKEDPPKENAFASMERKLKDSNGQSTATDRTQGNPIRSKQELVPCGIKEMATLREKIQPVPCGIIKEMATLREKILLIEGDANLEDAILNGKMDDGSTAAKSLSNMASESVENGTVPSLANRIEETSPAPQYRTSTDSKEMQADVLLKEMKTLRERNSAMESELKDMREKYSELSLRFAVVEGEREELVMNLRSAKNPRKT